MTRYYSANAAKKLALKFILDNIDYKKKCLYLQEIIAMGKEDHLWLQALTSFFDTPMKTNSFRLLSKN
ncbi:hypothetical protein CAP36_01510 [Chitinophagaceae bacterium IBVUCB2]|nr:hypothetical protein CAP36_01510 [Chitinophagaceae bacterium IBVUCB2]